MKFRIKWLMLAIATVATIFLLTACNVNTQAECPPLTVQKSATELSIKLYLDGTPSMEGFVDKANSQYISWITRLNRALQNPPMGLDDQSHKVRSLKYFRLGSQADSKRQEFKPDDFIDATERSFYNGSKYPSLSVSEIDTAIAKPTEINELTIVVTDLYQAKDNIDKVVAAIRNYLTSQDLNYAVGIIGIKSEFNGRVYTEGTRTLGDFPHDSKGKPDRPFYILCVGQIDDISYYFKELLAGQSGVGETINAVIYSPHRLFSQSFTLMPVSQADLSKAVNPSKPNLKAPDFIASFSNLRVKLDSAVQGLQMGDRESGFSLTSTAKWVPIPYAASWDVGKALQPNLIPQSFDRKAEKFANSPELTSQQPTLKEVLRFDGWQLKEQTLSFVTQFLPEKILGKGIYLFQAEVSVKPEGNPFAVASDKAWWNTWSSEPGSKDGKLTHNLATFMETLQKNAIVNVMQQNPPLVGRFCYLVQKGK